MSANLSVAYERLFNNGNEMETVTVRVRDYTAHLTVAEASALAANLDNALSLAVTNDAH
jgi:hypothetical protein